MKQETPYILPLLWLHGEDLPVIEAEIRAMHSAGLRGFIVESRPFPEYMGDYWWETLEFIFSLAEELEMQAMLFDDSHFPSGYGDGKIAAEHPEHLRLLLEPVCSEFNHPGGNFTPETSRFLVDGDKAAAKAFLFQKTADGKLASGTVQELPADGTAVELAPGSYTLNVWKITRNGGENHTRNYINFLSKPAVKCFIDTIYRPHVQKLKHFINRSFIGFFSDEPRIANISSYYALPGKLPMSLPYHPSLELDMLPHLMLDSDDMELTGHIRQRFMDQVSRLYSEAFPQQIGRFCSEYGLLYIGHIVEDNGAHSRIGYSNGHYFRSQQGQSWPGVDTVLGQNRPGHTDGILQSVFGKYDSRFFHWELMLLGGSCGAINDQPAFVENFGAYGWAEGLAQMKWHTDLALVRGINRLVPHAFSPKYPDPDCPPHFYPQGNTLHWRFFHLWREYADRLCSLLSSGSWTTRCAVLYHAEAEWSTRNTLYCRDLIRELSLQQYSSLIVPLDAFVNNHVQDGKLTLGKVTIDTLLAADFELLPQYAQELLNNSGLRVIKVTRENLTSLPALLGDQAEHLQLSNYSPTLRYLHLDDCGREIYFMVNESLSETVDTRLDGLSGKNWYWYDPLQDRCYAFDGKIFLDPGESLVLTGSSEALPALSRRHTGTTEVAEIIPEMFDCSPEFDRNFAGTLHYQSILPPLDIAGAVITLPAQRNDVVSCFIGETPLGTCFAPPYRFYATGDLLANGSQLRLELTNTNAPLFRDGRFDADVEPPAPGLASAVKIMADE